MSWHECILADLVTIAGIKCPLPSRMDTNDYAYKCESEIWGRK